MDSLGFICIEYPMMLLQVSKHLLRKCWLMVWSI